MQILFSEYQNDYSTYTFAYAIYAIQERPEEISDLYARGFLPYTGDLSLPDTIFYLARSVRVDLERFEDSSENRRVNRKAQELDIRMTVSEKAAFSAEAPEFTAFCTQYAADRFRGGRMDAPRLRYVLGHGALTHILTFHSAAQVFGYVLVCLTPTFLHYWYAFFDTAYLRSHSLGKWMMWRSLRWAQEQQLRYAYLGTCYTPKALYKIRDHSGSEFFDGVRWNADVTLLKHLCQRDEAASPPGCDLLKSAHEAERALFSPLLQ